MRTKKISFISDGSILHGIKTYPDSVPAPGVILFHGLTNTQDDCPLIRETSLALNESGFHTLTFDFFGSGGSPGKMEDKTMDILLQNANDAVEYFLKDDLVINIGIWGRSIGGTVVCLIEPHKNIKARITAGGGCFLEKSFLKKHKELKKLIDEGQKVAGTGKYKGRYHFGKDWYKSLKGIDRRITNNLKRINSVLVLATTPDIKVPLVNAAHIINNVKEPKRIQIYEGVDHDYKGVEDKAVKETLTWFENLLKK